MIIVHKTYKKLMRFKTAKILPLSILLIILLSLSSASQFSYNKQSKLPWYEVSDWEVDACSKWGGRTETEHITTEQPAQSYGDMTITIQARKTKAQNETLYEVTYFLESYSATTDYKIKLVHQKTGAVKEITSGTLGPANGATDYWAQNLKENYDTAVIEYYKGSIIAPIVEVQ